MITKEGLRPTSYNSTYIDEVGNYSRDLEPNLQEPNYFYGLSLDGDAKAGKLFSFYEGLKQTGEYIGTLTVITLEEIQAEQYQRNSSLSILRHGIWIPHFTSVYLTAENARLGQADVTKISIKPARDISAGDMKRFGYNDEQFSQFKEEVARAFSPDYPLTFMQLEAIKKKRF